MSNQYSGEMKAAILEAIKRPQGMQTKDLSQYTALQLGRVLQKLQHAGLVFRARVGGKYGYYFDSMERAEAFEIAHQGRPLPGVTIGKVKGWTADAPAVNPRNVKPKKVSAPKPRFAPDDDDKSWKAFSNLKPGQYLTEPSSCAARAFS